METHLKGFWPNCVVYHNQLFGPSPICGEKTLYDSLTIAVQRSIFYITTTIQILQIIYKPSKNRLVEHYVYDCVRRRYCQIKNNFIVSNSVQGNCLVAPEYRARKIDSKKYDFFLSLKFLFSGFMLNVAEFQDKMSEKISIVIIGKPNFILSKYQSRFAVRNGKK